jgi:hypothetical protein
VGDDVLLVDGVQRRRDLLHRPLLALVRPTRGHDPSDGLRILYHLVEVGYGGLVSNDLRLIRSSWGVRGKGVWAPQGTDPSWLGDSGPYGHWAILLHTTCSGAAYKGCASMAAIGNTSIMPRPSPVAIQSFCMRHRVTWCCVPIGYRLSAIDYRLSAIPRSCRGRRRWRCTGRGSCTGPAPRPSTAGP